MRNTLIPRRAWLKAGVAAALGLSGLSVSAQTWPDRPIRLIVPAPAGGGQDAAARALGERLSGILGQPVVVDNKPGAAGIIGVSELLKPPHDGSSFLGSSSISL